MQDPSTQKTSPISTMEVGAIKSKITRQLNLVASRKAEIQMNLDRIRTNRDLDTRSDEYEALRTLMDTIATAVDTVTATVNSGDERISPLGEDEKPRKLWEEYRIDRADEIFELEDLFSHVKLTLNRAEERFARNSRDSATHSNSEDTVERRPVIDTVAKNAHHVEFRDHDSNESPMTSSRSRIDAAGDSDTTPIRDRDNFRAFQNTANRYSSRSVAPATEPRFAKGFFSIELPYFDGDPTRWDRFWGLFQLHVHDQPYDELVKMSILLKFTTGEARDFIESESAEGTDYQGVIDALLEFFDDVVVKKSALYKAIEDVPRASYTADSISSMNRTLSRLLNSLSRYESIDNMRMRREIKSKLPREMILDLARLERDSTSEWSTPKLIKEIKEAIKLKRLDESLNKYATDGSGVLVTAPATPVNGGTGNNQMQARKQTGPPRTRSNQIKSETCIFCHKPGHSSAKCFRKVSQPDANKIVIEAKVCRKCLTAGHRARDCSAANCSTCGGDHHARLCFRDPTLRPPADRQSSDFRHEPARGPDNSSGLNFNNSHRPPNNSSSNYGPQPFRGSGN